jgi:hypothetical protein
MKRKSLLLLIGLIIGLTAGYFFLRHRTPTPPRPTATTPPAPALAPTPVAKPTTPPAEVAIQDGKTIDFSSGQPRVQDSAADRAALEKAKREMNEATKDVTFAPTKPAEPASPSPSTAKP